MKMNSSKTEVTIFGSQQQVSEPIMKSMCINSENTEISDCIKYLSVRADQHLIFKYQIKMKCKTAMWNSQNLKTTRSLLTIEVANTLAMGTIISHLDYCNIIYSGLAEIEQQKLQRVQNIRAKTVLGKGKFTDPTDHFRTLHLAPNKIQS